MSFLDFSTKSTKTGKNRLLALTKTSCLKLQKSYLLFCFVLSGCCRFILTVLLSKRTEGCKDRLVNHGFFRDCSGTRLRPSIVSRNKSVLLHSLFIGVSCKKADESCSSTAVTSTAEKEATIQSLHTFRGSK